VETLGVDLGDPAEGTEQLQFSCVPVEGLACEFALDLRYEQWWFYHHALLGSLSASIALAPGETVALSVRNTQRKQFDRETVNEVERSEQAESTIADKDVLNVTRSSSRTNNWTISGNASFTLPKFSAGISGSLSQSVNEAATSSAQRSSESTRRSASNLKTLQKVQIRETAEVTTEASTARTIVNPYRDRSLRLDVYSLTKEYCVEFHLCDFVPVLILDLETVTFDRTFVLTNGAFLADVLIDRWLGVELTDALQGTTDLRYEGTEERAGAFALLALGYLFDGPEIFNWPFPWPTSAGWPIPFPSRPSGWNENLPSNSFESPLEQFSGFYDATENKVAVVFSILAFYYRLYRDHVKPYRDKRQAVELAVSLNDVLAPRWSEAEETEEIRNAVDPNQATEVLRRLGGFLTMTSGIISPLLKPAEEEREAKKAAERAEFVIGRAIDHLKCHTRYYTEMYLASMAESTRMDAVYRFAEDVLRDRLEGAGDDLLDIFDPEASFLEGHRVVVPIRLALDSDDVADLLKRFHRKPPKIKPRLLDVQQLTIPMDGVHIEPSPGSCLLEDVPDPVPPATVHVVSDK
jgi:hypothetical protein